MKVLVLAMVVAFLDTGLLEGAAGPAALAFVVVALLAWAGSRPLPE